MSTGNESQPAAGQAVPARTRSHPLVRTVESHLEAPADAYALAENAEYGFVLGAWRDGNATVRSRRFACRLHDDTVARVGVPTVHHVEGTVETARWAREFLAGREDRALAVARAVLDWQERPPRRPFDGPAFDTL